MKSIDLKLFLFGKFFVWTPRGYTIFGALHNGQYYTLLSLKSSRKKTKPYLEMPGKCRFLNVKYEKFLEDQ